MKEFDKRPHTSKYKKYMILGIHTYTIFLRQVESLMAAQ